MSGFIGLGCNPTQREDSLADLGGVALGSMGYSDDGGMFIAVQADGAIAEGDLVQIENGFQIDQATTSSPLGSIIAVATAAFANNEYGWVQVYGNCQVQVHSGSNHAASNRVSIGDDGEISSSSSDSDAVAGVLTSASSGSDGRLTDCFLFFPKKVG